MRRNYQMNGIIIDIQCLMNMHLRGMITHDLTEYWKLTNHDV